MRTFVEAYEADQSQWVKDVDEMPELTAEISRFWIEYSKKKSPAKEDVAAQKPAQS